MNKLLLEYCTVEGDLTPELIQRKQSLDQSLEAELEKIDQNKSLTWVAKQRYSTELQAEYDELWGKELEDAGYVVRPTFESTENWYDDLTNLQEDGSEVEAIDDRFAEFNLSTSVDTALNKYPKDYFEIEYEGFTDEWEEDRFDPNSWYGHYTVSKSRDVDDFSYTLDPIDVLETLECDILPDYTTPESLEKVIKRYRARFGKYNTSAADKGEASMRKLMADYQKIYALCEEGNDDDNEKLSTFVADHLDDFFDLFYDEFKDKYEESAKDSLYW